MNDGRERGSQPLLKGETAGTGGKTCLARGKMYSERRTTIGMIKGDAHRRRSIAVQKSKIVEKGKQQMTR